MKQALSGIVGLMLCILAITGGCSHRDTEKNPTFTQVTDTIRINLMAFSPGNVSVYQGDTVMWINDDIVAHNVKEMDHHLFFSDTLHPGGSFRWIATANAEYICSIHPTMKGKITILKK